VSAALRAWWLALARRERTLVAAGASLALLAALYALAVEPAWKTRARLGAELPRLRAQAAEMDGLAQEARQLRGRAAGFESAEAAKRALEKALAGAGLGAARVAVIDERRLSVGVKGAPAHAWLLWVEQATRQSRLRVALAQVSRASARGVVDAEITFELAPRQ
jgi:general secretion pathway protein M